MAKESLRQEDSALYAHFSTSFGVTSALILFFQTQIFRELFLTQSAMPAGLIGNSVWQVAFEPGKQKGGVPPFLVPHAALERRGLRRRGALPAGLLAPDRGLPDARCLVAGLSVAGD